MEAVSEEGQFYLCDSESPFGGAAALVAAGTLQDTIEDELSRLVLGILM